MEKTLEQRILALEQIQVDITNNLVPMAEDYVAMAKILSKPIPWYKRKKALKELREICFKK